MSCRIAMAHFGSSAPNRQRPLKHASIHAEKIARPMPKEYDEQGREKVSLTERMEELGLCSQRRANEMLEEAEHFISLNRPEIMKEQLEEVIYLKCKAVYRRGVTVSPDETDIEIHPGTPIRLSKRMSELGMCSRREAAAILKAAGEFADERYLKNLKKVIYLRGKPVMDGAAVKVPPTEKHIEIRSGDDPPEGESKEFVLVPYENRPWEEIRGDTIVLNKPIGYVSGQEEHQHVPAVRLLTRDRIHLDYLDEKERQPFHHKSSDLHFDKWKFAGYDMMANSVPKHIRDTLREDELKEKSRVNVETLTGYAVAGRLDIDSTGVLIFTRAGIMARRLIEPNSGIQKEYIVKVQPAVRPTEWEHEMGLTRLPPPTKDLSVLLKKGNRLLNQPKSLKPLKVAEWLEDDQNEGGREDEQTLTMRLVMVQGKKRQIRRMCRELLGWHVVGLVRTSIGPVRIDTVPEGKWRPLTQREVKAIFEEQPNTKKPKRRR